MSARKRIDTTHPDCAEYTKKFHALWDAYYALEDEEKKKNPDWRGLDHPANAVTRSAYKKCCAATRELQSQYGYLFNEGTE